jgi:radical SAM superfamily enzyme YgiQ (UPF0313 family)
MDVLVISTNRNEHPVPVMPIGACMAAEAAERAGHGVRLLDLMFKREAQAAVEAALDGFSPDAVGLSVRNIDNNDLRSPEFFLSGLAPVLQAVRERTRPGTPVVLGGAAASVMTEQVLSYTGVSLCATGDGEAVFPALLESLASGGGGRDVPGAAYAEDGAVKVNPYRPPDGPLPCQAPDYRRWLDVGAYRSRLCAVPLQTKLGCRFRCVYCTYRKVEGDAYRLAEPEGVAEAVAGLSSTGLGDVEFVDNVFNSPREHALAVCEAVARRRLPARLQSIELNPLGLDDELVGLMERAGFTGMGITAESASQAVLDALKKGFTSDDVANAAEVVGRHRLPCLWIFMLGGPGETEGTALETLRFAERHIRPSDAVFFNIGVRVYPGTEIEKRARSEGLLSLGPAEMVEPVFYLSPQVDFQWLQRAIGGAVARNMNFITLDMPHVRAVSRIAHLLGIKPPLWKHTPFIRRALSLLGAKG